MPNTIALAKNYINNLDEVVPPGIGNIGSDV